MKRPAFLDKIANALGYIKQVGVSSLQWMGASAYPARRMQEQLASYTSWVYACVKARSEDVSQIKLKLYRTINNETGESEEVNDHDVLSLIRSVNPWMTMRELFKYTQAYKDLAGEAFWYLVKKNDNPNSPIVQIWMLRPDWMTIQTDAESFIKGYEYSVPGQSKIVFRPDQIIHHKEFNPLDPYRGLSVVKAAALTIDTDNYAELYNTNFFKNSAVPSVVLSTEQKLDDSIIKRMRAQWQAEYGGADKAHKMAILEGGLELQPFGIKQAEMQFLEGQGFNRDKVLALFETPKSRIGMTEGVTVSNAEATIVIYTKYVVKPLMEKFEDTLTEFLLPQYKDGQNLFFKIVDPVPENVELKIKKQESMFKTGSISPNEIRKENGMDEIAGLDDFYLPLNLIPVIGRSDQTGEQDVPAKSVRGSKAKTIGPAQRIGPRLQGKMAKEITGKIMKHLLGNYNKFSKEAELQPSTLPVETKEAISKNFIDKSEGFEKMFIAKVRGIFNRQKTETLARLENATKALSRSEINKVLFNLRDEDRIASQILVPVLLEFMEENGDDALAQLGLTDQVFNTTTATVMQFKNNEVFKGIKSMNRTTKNDLRRILSEGIAEGVSTPQLAKLIEDMFGDANRVRALRIARTEVIKAGNRGALEAYRQSNVVIGKEWFTALDERVCEWCGPLHGKIKALNTNFFHQGETYLGKEGGTLNLDYSDIGEPPLHPSCRCTLIPITGKVAANANEKKPAVMYSEDIEGHMAAMEKRVTEQVEEKLEKELGELNDMIEKNLNE